MIIRLNVPESIIFFSRKVFRFFEVEQSQGIMIRDVRDLGYPNRIMLVVSIQN